MNDTKYKYTTFRAKSKRIYSGTPLPSPLPPKKILQCVIPGLATLFTLLKYYNVNGVEPKSDATKYLAASDQSVHCLQHPSVFRFKKGSCQFLAKECAQVLVNWL